MTGPVRADARRNRERLLASAAAAFATADGPVTLEAVARDAGVGIGTLYRHFPTREDLIFAVYRHEVDEVCQAAGELLDRHPPDEALRRWMDRYASFVAAKRGMAEALPALRDPTRQRVGDLRAALGAAVSTVLAAGGRDGSLRVDVRAEDVVLGMAGIVAASESAEQRRRLLGLLVDGLSIRPRGSTLTPG